MKKSQSDSSVSIYLKVNLELPRTRKCITCFFLDLLFEIFLTQLYSVFF